MTIAAKGQIVAQPSAGAIRRKAAANYTGNWIAHIFVIVVVVYFGGAELKSRALASHMLKQSGVTTPREQLKGDENPTRYNPLLTVFTLGKCYANSHYQGTTYCTGALENKVVPLSEVGK